MQDEEQFTIRTKGALKRGRGEAEAQKARETPQEEKAEASAGEAALSIPVEVNFAAFVFSLVRSAFIHLEKNRIQLPVKEDISNWRKRL